jgi:vacuolar-type H+-ATPase subunit E/Vma4
MSREVLINDLKAKGEQQIAGLWREAREEVERFRAEAEQRLTGEQDRCNLAGTEAERAVQRRRTMAARRRAETIITRAEQELNARLLTLAREMLDGEWPGDRANLLTRLAAELPPDGWGRIRVNPADAGTASALFPGAAIVSDPQIPGGLVATSRDDRVTIDNTLSTRLNRIWSRLAPKLLQEASKDAALT